MYHSYEVRFLKSDGTLSMLLWVNYASDRQAIFSARRWLGADLSHAFISHNGRSVVAMDWKEGLEKIAV